MDLDKLDLPLGFGMALAQNEVAMHAFESMTEMEKKAIIRETHSVKSKREMEQLVSRLSDGMQG